MGNYLYEDYTSVDPLTWGPKFWFVIHCFAAHYPVVPSDLDKESALMFIKNLPFILPCFECKSHALEYIRSNKYNFESIISSKKKLEEFFFAFHNKVNLRIGKKYIEYNS